MCTNLEICSWEGFLWLAALCALQGRQNVLADNSFRFVGPATGTGHVPQLVLGVGEGGHGLLSLVRRDLVPLLQPGPHGMVPMLGFSQVFCVYYLKLRELV